MSRTRLGPTTLGASGTGLTNFQRDHLMSFIDLPIVQANTSLTSLVTAKVELFLCSTFLKSGPVTFDAGRLRTRFSVSELGPLADSTILLMIPTQAPETCQRAPWSLSSRRNDQLGLSVILMQPRLLCSSNPTSEPATARRTTPLFLDASSTPARLPRCYLYPTECLRTATP